MEKKEFQKILAKSLTIVDVGIKNGYFQENKKEELNSKLLTIFNNGIEYDIPGTAVYGVYVTSQKKLYYNAKVFKNEQEALIYILHEMKHGLDHFPDSIGFQKNNNAENVGSNEGATQRFATDIAEEILGEKIHETQQTSLGITLQTNLDEYQIEDKLNELLCKALGISKAVFLSAQNEENQETFNTIIHNFNKYANFRDFQQALDGIYAIQEETWFDENGNLLETEAKPTIEQTKRATELIRICQSQIFQYVQKSNPDKLAEIKEGFIVPMNEYGEIVRQHTDIDDIEHTTQSNDEIMSNRDMLYQADYMKYQEFLMNGVDLGDNTLVFISGLSVIPFEEIFEGEQTLKEILEVQNEQLLASIFVRSGDTYKSASITFDKNGVIEISDYQEIDSLDNIIEHIEHSEVIGNAPEYIRILKLQGKDKKAQEIQKKYEYFLKNKDRIDEIRQKFGEKSEEKSEMDMIAELLYNGELDGVTAGEASEKFDDSDLFKVDDRGIAYLTEDSFRETAEDARSIEARKKVLADLKQAQTNEKSQENHKEQGE